MAEAPAVCPVCADNCEGRVSCGRCGLPLQGRVPQPIRGLPPAKRLEQPFSYIEQTPTAPAIPPPAKTRRENTPAPLLPAGTAYILKSAFAILFLLSLTAGVLLLFLYQRQASSPASSAPRAANRYLMALARADYAEAYGMLSISAAARGPADEFRRLRGPGEWSWANLKLVALEPDAALLSYDLSVQGQSPQTLYLFLVKENGNWVVPFNLNLLKDVEDAMRRSDPDLALLKSQEAVRVNPRDPMARAYLCEASYFRKLPEQARPACAAALELASKYPSNLSAQSLQHAQDILAKLRPTP